MVAVLETGIVTFVHFVDEVTLKEEILCHLITRRIVSEVIHKVKRGNRIVGRNIPDSF